MRAVCIFGVLVVRLRLFLYFDIGDTSSWAEMTERAFATIWSTSLTNFATVLNKEDMQRILDIIRETFVKHFICAICSRREWHPAQPGRDSLDMCVDWEFVSTHGKQKNTSGGFGTNAFETAEFFFCVIIRHATYVIHVTLALLSGETCQNGMYCRRFRFRQSRTMDSSLDGRYACFQGCIPRGKIRLKVAKGSSGIRARSSLRKNCGDERVEDRFLRCGCRRGVVGLQDCRNVVRQGRRRRCGCFLDIWKRVWLMLGGDSDGLLVCLGRSGSCFWRSSFEVQRWGWMERQSRGRGLSDATAL